MSVTRKIAAGRPVVSVLLQHRSTEEPV